MNSILTATGVLAVCAIAVACVGLALTAAAVRVHRARVRRRIARRRAAFRAVPAGGGTPAEILAADPYADFRDRLRDALNGQADGR